MCIDRGNGQQGGLYVMVLCRSAFIQYSKLWGTKSMIRRFFQP
jgi:hypothetical protein